ncbi:MAG: tetratricopeptide repeat protein, partial [Candidatus Sumerlaeia bacterium]|nr:tetratricopeptide repeat protein [Candidatus Sumerlaeia bacterium]
EAAEAFREILREWPEDDGVRLALMGTLIGVGQGEEARSVARGIRPGTSAWATAAEMLVRAGLPRV